ncbi:nitrite reductase small subunit NirD [Streptomyces aureocirculatus]|uniref:nitrite reductase small subunit NirD n=1 Tax=Streptomyces aureocirculatus TaxID=67275 RepID=UPI0004C8968E|nr:nitrite reductase small subunit NirD [Streptomyces aureocirculatus]
MTTATATATAAPAAPTTDAPAAASVQLRLDGTWLTVCAADRLTPGRGVAVLLPDGRRQVALFLDRGRRLYAIDNRDPFSGAAVLARGLIGSADGRPFVASPLLKQRFDLASGRCLDDDDAGVAVYEVRVSP